MYYFELLLLLLLQFQLYKLLWLTVNIMSLYSRLVFYFILDWCAVPKKKTLTFYFRYSSVFYCRSHTAHLAWLCCFRNIGPSLPLYGIRRFPCRFLFCYCLVLYERKKKVLRNVSLDNILLRVEKNYLSPQPHTIHLPLLGV